MQKTGMAGYQALGQQVSARTGVHLPGATATPLGSPKVDRTEADYDDFWAENGIKDTAGPRRPENAAFVGQQQKKTAQSTPGVMDPSGKDDDWENW